MQFLRVFRNFLSNALDFSLFRQASLSVMMVMVVMMMLMFMRMCILVENAVLLGTLFIKGFKFHGNMGDM